MARNWAWLVGITLLLSPLLAGAQSTGRGDIVAYNDNDATVVLDFNESDLRYNQMELSGGILSLTINDVTLEAYLIPAWRDTSDLENTIRLIGFDPALDGIELALIVARSGSTLQHLDGVTNPLYLFKAQVGDAVRVEEIAPPPVPIQSSLETVVQLTQVNGDIRLNLTAQEAEAAGLFKGVTGTVTLNGQTRSFLRIEPDQYFTAPPADMVLSTETADEVEYLILQPSAAKRTTQSLAQEFRAGVGLPVTLAYPTFDYSHNAAGRVVEIQGDAQQLITDVPASELDNLGVQLGGYVVVAINGLTRAAMVMDEVMFAEALELGGLASNYVVLRQSGILKIIYLLADGRTAQGIFNADIGSQVRLRAAAAIETIIRPEAIVKAIAEIDPRGFLYTDVTPFELSFLEVTVGQYVDVRINGITYRSLVVDERLLNQVNADPNSREAILVYPLADRILLTQRISDTLTAEVRFQASVGDVVVFERAPN